MNRRTTLAKFFGRSQSDQSAAANTALSMVVSGLDPYTGPFGYEQAAHLLRRATFGPTYQQIKDAVANGLDATMQQLFADQPMPAPPLNHYYTDDPNVPVGQTWVDAPYVQGVQQIQTYRNQSLRAWTIGVLLQEGISIREKLTLFWHNHYVTSDINDPKYIYKYITTLRENALGNFRELTKMVNIDPSMLRYLNGRDNSAVAPNENYARELLELFTIGKGPIAGPGDYTNYTEDDVVQMARVLTGWRDVGMFSNDPNLQPSATFLPNRHDQGTKQLSYRFNNTVIPNLMDQEHAHLIDVIFSKDECARFICRKLYRWFIYYVITPDAEANVIQPMAQILLDNDYEIRPALETLLRSEHFFDMLSVGPMIKSPVDFTMSLFKTLEVDIPQANLNQLYRHWWQIFRVPLPLMQQEYYALPSVAGWKAYYQEPVFYRDWISAATLNVRMDFTTTMITAGYQVAGAVSQVDVLKVAAAIDMAEDPNILIETLAKILYPQPLTQGQLDFLKDVLIPGLPDFEWTVEYAEYLNNPTDPGAVAAVQSKLQSLLVTMLSMPEFYLS
ncbi:MAG: DUF1800 domain-containing protein [Lewinellaceae bacterium]|nr:DUF1800 domain-containing protein [Saprospiraceae bacterium]MCB9341379.1 DUF1800 domain-containing protein [Lewinellaceae bacterium]